MNANTNPFIRGYSGLSIERLVAIRYEDDCPLTYLPLHESQSHLGDLDIARFECVFCDDFVIITESQTVPDDLDEQCSSHGVAQMVVYAIMATEAGKPFHVGDTYTAEAARDVIRRLTFETGHYSRCWEISSGHIPAGARVYLQSLADISTPTGMFFEAFRIPYSGAVGVKLIATPWTDENLEDVDGGNAQALRKEQTSAGVPEPLVELLHLAALADVRFLIFDPDAASLEGLPFYDD
ncbi:MAG: ABC transporter substrate-binding protein [Nitrospiraceae bacterium]